LPHSAARALRSDAQANHDRLLDAAARAFAREGSGASLKAIAKDAGVGIGTLYRRFPTRERLVEAVHRAEVARLCATAPALLARMPAAAALRTWAELFLEFLAAKDGMADVLRVVLAADDDLRLEIRRLLADAIGQLLAAGQAEGTLRQIEDPGDVMFALGGIALIAGGPLDRERARRLVSLLFDGLAAH
jgi:AcrR family transcriptional regulator